jgi:hypothetical protein
MGVNFEEGRIITEHTLTYYGAYIFCDGLWTEPACVMGFGVRSRNYYYRARTKICILYYTEPRHKPNAINIRSLYLYGEMRYKPVCVVDLINFILRVVVLIQSI